MIAPMTGVLIHAGAAKVTAALVCLALAATCLVGATSSAKALKGGLASRLTEADPGALVNGRTIVATGNGERVVGDLHRANFIAGLGSNQTIVGGSGNDNLTAFGEDVTILAGSGTGVLYGGQRATLVDRSGHHLLVERGADGTVRLDTGGSEAVLAGRDDRVLCSGGSAQDAIYLDASASVSASCRADHARLLALKTSAVPAPLGSLGKVSGDGSNANPFVAPCDHVERADCTVTGFDVRKLSGGWDNEYVPAYRCPAAYPYLLNHGYAPPFTSWGPGVEIQEDSDARPIGVSISLFSYFKEKARPNLFSGTLTGYPASSATNWIWGGDHWYKVVLHCTSDRCRGTDLVGAPPGCPSAVMDDRARRRA
jgi:hypothetical protein